MAVTSSTSSGAWRPKSGEIIFKLLTLIVILSPLPLGSVKPWAWSLIAFLVSLLLLAWWAQTRRHGDGQRISLNRIKWVAFPDWAVMGWSLFQAYAPVPGFLAHPAWEDASKALGYPLQSRITADPEAAKGSFINLACYGAVFYLCLQLAQDRKRAKALFLAITGMAAVSSVYGIVQYSMGGDSLLWYDLKDFTRGHAVRGTFVYKNAFATYAGLSILCLLALTSGKLSRMTLALESRNMTSSEKSAIYSEIFPFAIVFITLFAALTLSMSRAGFACSCLAMAVYSVLHSRKQGWSMKSALAPLAALLLTGILFHFMASAMERRMQNLDKDSETREELYDMTLRGIWDAPLTGHGHGSFERNIRLFYPGDYTKNVNTAHNVYLDAAFELGIPSAFLLCVSIISIGFISARGIWAEKTRIWSYSSAGVSAVILIALHSLFDFSMQVPAVAITFAAITGAACARSLRSRNP